jgi:SAM-dependent methyltransferase
MVSDLPPARRSPAPSPGWLPTGQTDRRCVACGGLDLRPFLEIDDVPVECNLLLASEEEARTVPRGDIQLALCRGCGLIWNLRFDPGLASYDTRYENSLWSSPTFADYARALIDRLIDQYDIRGKRVLSIGSGRAEFLTMLCERGGNQGLGFDPAYDLAAGLPGPHVHMVRDYFRDRYAEIEADLVICRHVLEHLSDPAGLLRLVRRTLTGRTGALTHFEVPSGAHMLRTGSIWDVIYEHPSYFTESSLTGLFRRTGFRVEHVYTGYGDQYIGLEAVPEEGSPTTATLRAVAVGALEGAVRRFRGTYRSTIDAWADRLAGWSRSGHRVVVWGAGSKGIMFLNTVPGAEAIEAIVDLNPRKQGHHAAGTGHPIVGPEWLRGRPIDVILVMNPLYRDEILATLEAVRAAGRVVSMPLGRASQAVGGR